MLSKNINIVSSDWLEKLGRLDAPPFCSESFLNRQLISNSTFPKIQLGRGENAPAKCWMPGREQKYVESKTDHSMEIFSPSDLQKYQPKVNKYINKNIKSFQDYVVHKNWVLITRSGTIGLARLVDDNLADKCFSDDLIRVVPNGILPPGYLYAFLASSIGQGLLRASTFGSVVPHVYPEHVADLSIPLLPTTIQNKIHELIIKASILLVDANIQLDKANSLVHSVNNLPYLDHVNTGLLDDSNVTGGVRAFIADGISNHQLLADRYDPNLMAAEKIVKMHKNTLRLGDLVASAFGVPLFKHIYVEADQGIPLFGSADLFKIKISEQKFISKTETKAISKYLVKNGWILIASSGSIGGVIGRTTIVHHNFENIAVSNHAIRIIADNNRIFPGYLLAYLSSEYGYRSIIRTAFGSSVPEIHLGDVMDIPIPIPSRDNQNKISELVLSAYTKRSEAVDMESKAISIFEDEIKSNQRLKG